MIKIIKIEGVWRVHLTIGRTLSPGYAQLTIVVSRTIRYCLNM